MMISPDGFVSIHKKDSLGELRTVRDELFQEVTEFEQKEAPGDRSGKEWQICPSPEVVYQMNLEYLAEVCLLLSGKYNEEVVFGEETSTAN